MPAGDHEDIGKETENERTDRQLVELLNELRIALPGAQVLPGFLLTVPLATRFGRTDHLQRVALFLCLLLAAAGTMLLMAPPVYHRIRWGHGGKSDVAVVAHRLFLAGSRLLGAGLVAVVFLVGDVLFGMTVGVLSAALVALTMVATWYTLPRSRSRRAAVRAPE
jgi:hypothetical protein